MILKLTKEGIVKTEPQKTPEDLNSVFIKYIFPKGLNHLKPVLVWGNNQYEGNNIYIKKPNDNKFDMKVTLYDGEEKFKTYTNKDKPSIFIAYSLDNINPDLLNYIRYLEEKNRELEEKGDVL